MDANLEAIASLPVRRDGALARWSEGLDVWTMIDLDLGKLFDLLVLARNSKDEEALQKAIDLVAVASSRADF